MNQTEVSKEVAFFPCGCRVLEFDEGGYQLIYCPLHAAAPAMYEKVVKIKKWLIMLRRDAETGLQESRFLTMREAYEHDFKNLTDTIADIDTTINLAEGKVVAK